MFLFKALKTEYDHADPRWEETTMLGEFPTQLEADGCIERERIKHPVDLLCEYAIVQGDQVVARYRW